MINEKHHSKKTAMNNLATMLLVGLHVGASNNESRFKTKYHSGQTVKEVHFGFG